MDGNDLLFAFAPFGELNTDKKLADKDLLAQPMLIAAEQSQAFESDGLPIVFSISAQGQMSVSLFNDEGDADDLGLIDYPGESLLSFDPAKEAYLKYDVQVYPKSKLAGTIGDLGLGITGGKGIRLSFYCKHSNQSTIREATLGDLPNFPLFFRGKDLSRIQAHDAFAYSAEGELRASGEISWSDVLAESVNLIPSLFPKAATVDLSISPKITVKFDLSIKDHFSYVLKKNADSSYSVSIAKIKNSSTAGGIGASIGVKLSNPEAIERQLDELLAGACTSLLSKSPEYVGKAIEAFKSDKADGIEVGVIEKLAELFGMEDWKSSLDVLRQKWEDFQARFKKGIKEAAESGAMLTFSYEFKRIKEGREILKASFTSTGELERYHGDFLKLDMKSFLLDYCAGKTIGVSVETYFNQTKIATESAWGFGLKVWDREFVTGRDFKKSELIVTKDIRQHQQVTLTAVQGYDWKLGKGSGRWLSQWEASMPSFSLALEPRLTEFEFGWMLKFFLDNVKIKSETELKKLLDSGANWGCIAPGEIDTLARKYFPVFHKQRVSFQKQIYFPKSVLMSIFQQIHVRGFDDTVKKLLAKSLAASLPYQDDFPGRTNSILREQIYTPVWFQFLNHPETPNGLLAQITAKHLENHLQARSLVEAERKAGKNNQGIWLADVAFVHPHLHRDLLSCLAGLKQLGEGLQLGSPVNKQLENSYEKIEKFLGQSFYLEVLGNFLLRAVGDNPFARDAVQKAVSISYGEEEEARTIHIGMV